MGITKWIDDNTRVPKADSPPGRRGSDMDNLYWEAAFEAIAMSRAHRIWS
jgi:hypothetical protein